MTTYSARYSRTKLTGQIALMLGLAAMFGIWMAGFVGTPPKPGREWFTWGSVSFFLILAAISAVRLFDSEEQFRVSAKGLFYKPWSGQTIPWDAIADAHLMRFTTHSSIQVLLVDAAQHPPSARFARLALPLNRLMSKAEMSITLAGMTGDTEMAMRVVRKYKPARPRPRKRR